MEASWNIPITDPTQVGEARRIATALASSLLFNEIDGGKVALAVTEIGNNIHRHTGHGELLLRSLHDDSGTGIEVLGVDHGNRRSEPEERGHCIVSRVYRSYSKPPRPSKALSYDYGIVSVPHPNERVCGDGYFMHEDEGVCTIMVVDGYGHGLQAAEISRKACELLEEHVQQSLESIMTILHRGLYATEGAAIGLARILPDEEELRFIGVGNVCGSILQPHGYKKRLLSYPGVVGKHLPEAMEQRYDWSDESCFVLNSVGLQTTWDISTYPHAHFTDMSILAGTLYRDFNRACDDVTIMTVKAKPYRGLLT